MTWNNTKHLSSLDSLSKATTFGKFGEGDFQSAIGEDEERRSKLRQERLERIRTREQERKEKEDQESADLLIAIRLTEEENYNAHNYLQWRSKPSRCGGYGRGRVMDEYARSSHVPSLRRGYQDISEVCMKTERPTYRSHQNSEEEIRPALKDKPITQVENIVRSQISRANGSESVFNNKKISEYWRPEEAVKKRPTYSAQHYKDLHDDLNKSSSDNETSTSSSLNSLASTSPASPLASSPPSKSPCAQTRPFRRKGVPLGANFSNKLDIIEPNNNRKLPDITDVYDSSSRTLVPNGTVCKSRIEG